MQQAHCMANLLTRPWCCGVSKHNPLSVTTHGAMLGHLGGHASIEPIWLRRSSCAASPSGQGDVDPMCCSTRARADLRSSFEPRSKPSFIDFVLGMHGAHQASLILFCEIQTSRTPISHWVENVLGRSSRRAQLQRLSRQSGCLTHRDLDKL
jgi:hypothetical protein